MFNILGSKIFVLDKASIFYFISFFLGILITQHITDMFFLWRGSECVCLYTEKKRPFLQLCLTFDLL